MLVLTLLPFLIFLLLLFSRKIPLVQVAALSLLTVIILATMVWQMDRVFFYHSLIKGFLVALDIFVILFGAVFFLEILKNLNIIQNISFHLESVSKDHRVQVIFLAWLLENFLEGTSGFGTPSMVVVPLLVGIGLQPLSAVIISLLGNSSAGVFGAAGTPIRVGLSDLAGPLLPKYAALINLVGFLVPVFMLWIVVAKEKNARDQFFGGLPFALWAGLVFVLSSLITVFLGQEFPSILGSLLALTVVFITTKLRIFLPKKVEDPHPAEKPAVTISLVKSLTPYLLLIILLILGKLTLTGVSFSVPLTIKHSISLYNPGLAFLFLGCLLSIFSKNRKLLFLPNLKTALKKAVEPFLVIALVSAMVQLMIYSGNNISGQPAMLEVLAQNFKNQLLPFFAPLIGAFGSFLTGSVTVSNLMFGKFLSLSALDLNFNTDLILALAVVGAAAGNMIALADIMAAETAVGLKNQERLVLKGVIIPCLTIVFITGSIGLILFGIV